MQRRSAQIWVIALFIVGLSAGCGSDPLTPVPTDTPTPLPTATPIPGYVGGEEGQAYASFLMYYQNEVFDCYFDPVAYLMETVVDAEYPGKAIYVGDGVWRFYVQVISYDQDIPEETRSYKEEMLQVRSFPDRTWENVCTPYREEDYYPEEPEYEPDYPDYPEGEPEEPPDQEWP